jgi:hypothetical protein
MPGEPESLMSSTIALHVYTEVCDRNPLHVANGEYVMSQTDTRVEKDSLGDVAVPAYKLWGAPERVGVTLLSK